jgi:hypothetical protein
VKTLVQEEVQSENVTFFTARSLTVSGKNSPGIAWDRPMGDDSQTCVTCYPMDGTSRCRIMQGKTARTASAGLRQLATWERENLEEATPTDGSD